MRIRQVLLVAAISAIFLGARPAEAGVSLPIPVIRQQTPVWCWAATATMALQASGYPNVNPAGNYQCGIVAVAFPQCHFDCSRCIRPIGVLPNIVTVIRRYQDYVQRRYNIVRPRVRPSYRANPGFEDFKDSLNSGFPVIAGISAAGAPVDPASAQHAVLVSGYDEFTTRAGTTVRLVIVNDPFVYAPMQNPYRALGAAFHPDGRITIRWEALRDGLNLSSAVFLVS